VGEAAGPWECRFSGIPFTGELQLLNPDFPIAGKRSSLDVPVRPIRKKPPFTSGSAVMFWEAMLPYYPGFVLWNALPLHPHRPGNPLSVRAPRKKEILRFLPGLKLLRDFLRPQFTVAVGGNADFALRSAGESPFRVRHPSQGGKREFASGIREVFHVLT